MKVYGHFMSAPANQVRLTASALGVAHDYQHVDLMNGEQRTPEYLAVNAFGRVPAIEDDGFKLAESNAICRYLACKGQSELYPADVKTRAEIDQWMDFAAHHVRANMGKVLFNKVFAPMMGMDVDEKSLNEGRENLDAGLPVIDDALSRRGYIAADRMTIADTAMLAAMEPFEMIDYDVARFGNVKAWRDKMTGEPFYQRVHAHYGAEMNAQQAG